MGAGLAENGGVEYFRAKVYAVLRLGNATTKDKYLPTKVENFSLPYRNAKACYLRAGFVEVFNCRIC